MGKLELRFNYPVLKTNAARFLVTFLIYVLTFRHVSTRLGVFIRNMDEYVWGSVYIDLYTKTCRCMLQSSQLINNLSTQVHALHRVWCENSTLISRYRISVLGKRVWMLKMCMLWGYGIDI